MARRRPKRKAAVKTMTVAAVAGVVGAPSIDACNSRLGTGSWAFCPIEHEYQKMHAATKKRAMPITKAASSGRISRHNPKNPAIKQKTAPAIAKSNVRPIRIDRRKAACIQQAAARMRSLNRGKRLIMNGVSSLRPTCQRKLPVQAQSRDAMPQTFQALLQLRCFYALCSLQLRSGHR